MNEWKFNVRVPEHTEESARDSIAARVVAELIRRGWHITFAESCTGGLAAGRLVDIPDASRVLDRAFVTYANDAKHELLGVRTETLDAYGAVSEQTAREMAAGAARAARAEIGVGITGIAGPGGGTDEKPVGTVCFGFSIGGAISSCTVPHGALGRAAVRQASVDFVFSELCRLLDIER